MCNMDVRINQGWSTALEVPVQGQSLVETDQSIVQSLGHKKCELWQHRRLGSGHFFQSNFTGIILRAIWVNWATQNWSRGNLKKWHFFTRPPISMTSSSSSTVTYFIVFKSFGGSLLSPQFHGVLCDIPIRIIIIFIFVVISLDHCWEQICTSTNDKTIYLIIWIQFIVTQKQ